MFIKSIVLPSGPVVQILESTLSPIFDLVLLLSALADDGSLLTDSPLKVKAVTKE
jgi:hypothetical protein